MLSSRESGSADLPASDLCSAGSKSTGFPAWELTASGRTEARRRRNITDTESVAVVMVVLVLVCSLTLLSCPV